jgi:hypothetical protein
MSVSSAATRRAGRDNAMLLVQLIVILLVIGVLLYVVETLLPIDAAIKNVIRIVVLLAVVLWLLAVVGLLPGGALRIGPPG